MADSHFPVYQMKFQVSNSISLVNIKQKNNGWISMVFRLPKL